MVFSSFSFFAFLLATLGLYGMARSQRERAAVLLGASLIFYASWKPAYLLLLGASLGINYLIYQRLLQDRSKVVLIFGIALNLFALGTAKYLAFLTDTLFAAIGLAGLAAPDSAPDWMRWALPLGISFYTFHMLSAMIDAYRGVWLKPVSFQRWCLYVTFFPHLIAGPILRPGQLIDQLGELSPLTGANFRLGGMIFAGGLIKKIIFADNLAPIADSAFAAPSQLDAISAWIGTLAFAFQIYFDFSGYSEMAIGLALLFGVSLPRNFLYPYISRSPTEFWRRWHITLSLWLRDYLYISLGGNRRGTARTYLNLGLTMLLGGLWHGASWTFVVWGGLHGAYLIGHRLIAGLWDRMGMTDSSSPRQWLAAAGMPVTFLLVLVTWVFFRAGGFSDAWAMLMAMGGAVPVADSGVRFRTYEVAIVVASAVLVWLEPWVVSRLERYGIDWWWRVPYPLRGAAYAIGVLLLVAFGGPAQKFIYFDF